MSKYQYVTREIPNTPTRRPKQNPAAVTGAAGLNPDCKRPKKRTLAATNSGGGLPTQALIIGELIGCDSCTAVGVATRGGSPVFKMCRLLVRLGYPAHAELRLYRNGQHALTIRSIGEGAGLTVREGERGLYITSWKPFPLHNVKFQTAQNAKTARR